jgi:hypothetical protein
VPILASYVTGTSDMKWYYCKEDRAVRKQSSDSENVGLKTKTRLRTSSTGSGGNATITRQARRTEKRDVMYHVSIALW